MISEQADDQIADEMHRVTQGADLGWPYTYYDGVRKLRLVSPEYGGNGNKTAPPGMYSTPVLTFQSRRASEVDLLFYFGPRVPCVLSQRRVYCSARHPGPEWLRRSIRAL
jgi:glucose/arabinose dehydrogenase